MPKYYLTTDEEDGLENIAYQVEEVEKIPKKPGCRHQGRKIVIEERFIALMKTDGYGWHDWSKADIEKCRSDIWNWKNKLQLRTKARNKTSVPVEEPDDEPSAESIKEPVSSVEEPVRRPRGRPRKIPLPVVSTSPVSSLSKRDDEEAVLEDLHQNESLKSHGDAGSASNEETPSDQESASEPAQTAASPTKDSPPSPDLADSYPSEPEPLTTDPETAKSESKAKDPIPHVEIVKVKEEIKSPPPKAPVRPPQPAVPLHDEKTKSGVQKVKPSVGDPCQCKVTGSSAKGLHVQLIPSDAPGFVPFTHLTDRFANSAKRLKAIRMGQILTAVIFGDTAIPLNLSLKPSYIALAQDNDLPRSLQDLDPDLYPNRLTVATITKVTPVDVMIEIVSGLTGRMPKKLSGLEDEQKLEIGDTLLVERVEEFDEPNGKPVFILKDIIGRTESETLAAMTVNREAAGAVDIQPDDVKMKEEQMLPDVIRPAARRLHPPSPASKHLRSGPSECAKKKPTSKSLPNPSCNSSRGPPVAENKSKSVDPAGRNVGSSDEEPSSPPVVSQLNPVYYQYERLLTEDPEAVTAYMDGLFPAAQWSSISALPEKEDDAEVKRLRAMNIVCRRIRELSLDPRLEWQIFGVPQALQCLQGQLGDCGLITAIAAVAASPRCLAYLQKIFVTKTYNDAGLFLLRLCIDGRWQHILVDDRVPAVKNWKGQYSPAFAKVDGGIIFAALLEKAVAFRCGTFHSLDGGTSAEAAMYLTGHASEEVDVYKEALKPKARMAFFDKLLSFFGQECLMTAGFGRNYLPGSHHTEQDWTNLGVYKDHGYLIMSVRQVPRKDGSGLVRLLQLRCPSGVQKWKGAWSKDSPLWKDVVMDLRQEMKDSNSFFMSYDDFLKCCDIVTVTKDRLAWTEYRHTVRHPNSAHFVLWKSWKMVVTEEMEFDFVLHHFRFRGARPDVSYHCTDIALLILRRNYPGGPLIYVGAARRGVSSFCSASVTLGPGSYEVLPLAFGHFEEDSLSIPEPDPKCIFPKNVLAIHAQQPKGYDVIPSCMAEFGLGDAIISWLVQISHPERHKGSGGGLYFYRKRGAGLIVVATNRNDRCSTIRCDFTTGGHPNNFTTTRGAFWTVDTIPAHHSMVINILTPKHGRVCQYPYYATTSVNKVDNLPHNPVIWERVKDLHTPRPNNKFIFVP